MSDGVIFVVRHEVQIATDFGLTLGNSGDLLVHLPWYFFSSTDFYVLCVSVQHFRFQ